MIHFRAMRFRALRLFLLGLLLLGLGLGALLALADKAGLRAGVTESAVGVLGGGVVGELAGLDGDLVVDGEGLVGELDVLTLLGSLDLLSGGLTLLGGLGVAGEEDEALLVSLQALDVGLKGLLAQVLAAGVDGDTDGARELAGDVGLLEWMSEPALKFSTSSQLDIHTLSSAREKPRPARTRRLYLTVGQRTTGRSLSTGLGATLAAFSWRWTRREAFLPGCDGGVRILQSYALQAPLLSR